MTPKEIFRFLVIIPWVYLSSTGLSAPSRLAPRGRKNPSLRAIAVLLIEIVGYVLIFSHRRELDFLEIDVSPSQPGGPGHRLGFYLDGNRVGHLGALSPGGILERAGSRSKRTINSSAPARMRACAIRSIPA